jgi:hypothetical protein
MQLIKINLNILYLFLLTITSIFFIKSFIVNLLLLIVSSISIYYLFNNKVKVFDNSVNKILIILFIYIILNSIINFSQIDLFVKGIFQIRFYLLLIFVQIYSTFLSRNIRYFFLGNLIITAFIIIDLFIQYKTGENLFGFKPQLGNYRFTGIFNEEIVAGGFIFTFGFLGLSYFIIKQKYNLFFLFIFFFSFGIILTGDRNPLLMVFLVIFFNIIFNKSLRKYFLIYSFVLFFAVSAMTFFTEKSYNRYILDIRQMLERSQPVFKTEYWKNNQQKIYLEKYKINNPKNMVLKKKLEENREYFKFLNDLESIKNNSNGNIFKEYMYLLRNTIYGSHYLTAIEIIKDNPIFGTGVRTFRIVCRDSENEIMSFNRGDGCSTHPHNLHLEIISEIGFLGYFLFTIMIILLFYNVIFAQRVTEANRTVTIYLLSLILAAVFPFKPSGSIFSTWLGAQIWLLIAINYLFIIKDNK